METLRPLRNARFTDIIDYGFFLYKKHFRKIFLLDLMFYLPFVVLYTIINPVFTDNYLNFFSMPESIVEPTELVSSLLTLYAMLFGSLFIYMIYWITLNNVFDGSIIKILYADVVLQREKTIGQVVRECFRQFGTLVVGKILYGMIIYAVAMVVYLVIIAGVFAGTFSIFGLTSIVSTMQWLSVVLIILAAVILISAFVFIVLTVGYFNGKYWMFLPAVCIENRKAGQSIARCGNLAKNSFFLISRSYIAGLIIVALLPGTINMIMVFIVSGAGDFDMTLLQIGSVASQLLAAILQPLFVCIMTALYITLRVRREGLDIEVALWKIIEDNIDKAKRWTAEGTDV
ncbi:MAG TPA: hypothetical protein DCE11_08890 [Ruminiclostridium sp.]|nr:hypothetical protein [Clostridiaceae bacterium]HAA26210.1 hypothetical protein [Ruminiclostridium sp.]